MAVTNDQILYEIEVKSGKSTKDTNALRKEVVILDESLQDLTETIEKQSKTQKAYAEAINSSIKSLDSSQSVIDRVTNSVRQFATAMKYVDVAFNSIADPKTAERLDKILYILQAITSMTGFNKLSKSIEVMREKIDDLLKSLQELNKEFYNGDIDKTIDSLANSANAYFLLQKAITGLGATLITFSAIYATKFASVLMGYNLEKGILDSAKAISLATSNLNTSVIKSIDDLQISFNKYSNWISKVGLKNAIKWKLEDAISAIPSFSEALSKQFKNSQAIISSSITRWKLGLNSSVPEASIHNFADRIVISGIPAIKNSMKMLAFSIQDGILGISKTISETSIKAFEGIKSSLNSSFQKTITFIESPIVGIKNAMSKIASAFVLPIMSVKDSLPRLIEQISTLIGTAFKNIGTNAAPMIQKLNQNIAGGFAKLSDAFNQTNRSFSDLFKTAFTAAIDKLNQLNTAGNGTASIFAQMAKAAPKSTFILLAEYGSTLASVFGFLSLEMLKSESIIVKAFGAITLAASVAIGGVSTVISLLIGQVGTLAYKIGTVLSDAMKDFTKAANKADAVTAQFQFTVAGFNREFGEESVGTISQWEDVITSAMKNSAFSVNDLRKSVKLLIAEGTAINLTFDDTKSILAAGMDLAASSGNELNDVIVTILKSLAGVNNVGLLNLGINLSETALAHSKFSMELGKTVEEMSQHEILQARLYELYKQTNPILGAAANELNTIEGMTKAYNMSLEQLIIKFGRAGILTTLMTKASMALAGALNKIPQPILEIVSTLTDFIAIFLKIFGVITMFSLTILGVISAIKLFNIIIASSSVLQTALTASFMLLNKTIGTQIVAVTSLSAVWLNFQRLLSAGFLGLLAQVAAYILIVAKAMGTFTLALLTNPLFLKGAAIGVVIMGVVAAISELSDEMAFASGEAENQKGVLSTLQQKWKEFSDFLAGIFTAIVQSIKLIIIGIAGFGLALQRVRLLIKEMFEKPDEKLVNEIITLDEKIKNLGIGIEKSFDKMAQGFSRAGLNSVAFSQTLKDAADNAKYLEMKQIALAKAAGSVDTASMQVEVLGKEYQKLTNRVVVAKNEVSRLSAEFMKGSEDSKQVLADYKKAVEDLKKSELDVIKLRIDSLKSVSDITKEVQKQNLQLAGNETAQINAEFEERKQAVKELEEQISALGPVAGHSAKQIIDAYASIEEGRKKALQALQDKQDQEANENYLKFLKEQNDLLDGIAKRNRELHMQSLGDSLTERQKINEMLKFDTEELQKQIDHYKTQWGAQSAIVQGLEKQKGLLKAAAKTQHNLATMQLPDWINDLGESINDLFGKQNIDDFFSYIREKANNLATSPIVLEVQNNLSKIGSDLGMPAIGKGLGKVGDSITNGAKVLYNAGGAVSNVLQKAGGWIGAIIDVFLNADKYLNILIESPKQFLKVIQNLPALIQKVIDTLPGMIRAIAEALPGILLKIADMIPNLLAAVLESIPLLIERLAEALPELLVKLIGMIPKLMVMIGRAMFLAIQSLVKGLIRGLGRVFSGIKMPRAELSPKAVETLKKLTGSSSRLFQVKDLMDAAKDPLEKMTDGIENAFKKGTNWIKEAWLWVDEKIIKPLFEGLKSAWMWIYNKVILPIFDGLKAVWLWVYGNVISPIIDAFMKLWNWVYTNILQPITDAFAAVFNSFLQIGSWFVNALTILWDGVKVIWDNVLAIGQAFGNFILEAWQWVKENVIDKISGVITGAWQWVKENVIDKISGVITGAWQWVNDNILGKIGSFITDSFKWVKENIFSPEAMKKAFQGIFDFFSGLGTKLGDAIWKAIEGIGDKIAESIKSVIPGGGGGGIKIGGEVGKAAENIKKTFGFAEGGFVPLYAASGLLVPKGTDTVPAMLTPGEFIVNRRGVETAGLDMLSMINRGVSPQGSSGTYNLSFEINIDAKQPMDEGFIRGKLVPAMRDELKRASLDGQFVLSSRGIR